MTKGETPIGDVFAGVDKVDDSVIDDFLKELGNRSIPNISDDVQNFIAKYGNSLTPEQRTRVTDFVTTKTPRKFKGGRMPNLEKK